MRILHLTDFHFRATEHFEFDQNKLIDALCEQLSKEANIDFLFFTGDLVNAGNNLKDFETAKTILIDRIQKVLGLNESQIFICAGNHDVHRNQEMPALNLKFEQFKSNTDLDAFVKNDEDREYLESLRNHKNYISFQEAFYKKSLSDNIQPLYSTHKRTFQGNKIGIATLNSAWRSAKSETDRGNLLFPISFLKDQIEELRDCNFKILLLHHPISDFKDFNSSELEDLIFHHFHLMFSGHVHKKKQSTHITSDEGIFCCVSPATLSLFDNTSSRIGFTILSIDIDTFEIAIANNIYDKVENLFLPVPILKVNIPLNQIKHEQNEFRKTLRKRFREEVDTANDLFISVNGENISNGFLNIFTNPILKNKSKTELQGKNIDSTKITLDEITSNKSSYIIFGKDKSGKTSLLIKAKLDLLNNFSNEKIIPFYIDCKDYKNQDRQPDFVTLLSRYYEMNKSKVKELLKQYHLTLLIDNYDSGIILFNAQLTQFLEEYPNVSFIACTEETLSRSYESLKIGTLQHSNLWIHEISRNEVRELTNKWPNLSEEKKEHILDKISQIFYQLNIPMNYWTVSLFIWVYEKNSDANFHNNVDLIQLYVDGLLERNKIAFDKNSKINFDDFKIFISELAVYLIKNHEKNSYSADYIELINFTHGYREKNKKFVIGVEEIVDILLEKGILKKRTDSRYTFRLNGVFEYFLAYYMKDNREFRNQAIDDNHYYLSFSNELELCSGFNRRDEELLSLIFEKTKLIYDETNKKYSGNGSPDQNLTAKIVEVYDISVPLQEITNGNQLALSPQKQDELIEEFKPIEIQKAEVERKQYYESIESNPENLEKALFILSRVYRNSSLSNDSLNNDILDFILESACNLGFSLIDDTSEMELRNNEDASNSEQGKTLMKLMTNFMPLIVQTFLYDALAQNNLERIILEKIEMLKLDKKHNQFKLMLLYFLLIDLDVKANKNYIDEVIDNIDLVILKQTALIKLYTYLMFKSYKNPTFERFIIKRIEMQQVKINPAFDKAKFHQNIEKQKKFILLKNSSK